MAGRESHTVVAEGRRFSLRTELRAFIDFVAVCGIAIVQPLLSDLSNNVGVFVSARASGFQTIMLVLLIALVPPLVLWVVELAVSMVYPRARSVCHAILIGVVVVALVLDVQKRSTSWGPTAMVVVAIALGLLAAGLVLRSKTAREYLKYLAFAVPVFAVLFLGASPITPVVFSSNTGASGAATVRNPRRVVLVVMDEFPEVSLLDGTGHVDAGLFPNFAALAGESTWYRNDTTVDSFTEFAVPAILTGRYPKSRSDPPVLSSYPQNLFTLLGKTYKMNVHEVVTRLCPSKYCTGTDASGGLGGLVSQSADFWHDLVSPHRAKPNPFVTNLCDPSNPPLTRGEQFVKSLQPSSGPELDFLHVEFPHQPWHVLPSLQDSGCLRGPATPVWASTSPPSIHQRHLLQVQAADRLLGQIIAKLKQTGAFDNSLVIVTADHGVAFDLGTALRGVSTKNYPDIMWTPLFVHYPNERSGSIDDRVAESIDVVPTIADVLGVKSPWSFDGQSLRSSHRPEGMRPIWNWGGNTMLDGPFATSIPKGKTHLWYDGASGFARVLAARMTKPGPDPALRIYRSVDYGDLVGHPVSSYFTRQPLVKAVVEGMGSYAKVNPTAEYVPWALGQGQVVVRSGRVITPDVAIALHGEIVAVAPLEPAGKGRLAFYYVAPPSLMRRGRNVVSVYLVGGPVAHPILTTLPLG